MALVDVSKPGEKKKLIFAAVLGLGAIIVLYWALIGFDSRRPVTKTTTSTTTTRSTTNTQRPAAAPVSPEVRTPAVETNQCPVKNNDSSESKHGCEDQLLLFTWFG
jgi:hypothetical protein